MNAPDNHPELTEKTTDFAVDRWENEGGAHGHESIHNRYGRLAEAIASGPSTMSSRGFRLVSTATR